MDHFYEDVDGWFWFEPAYRHLLDTLPTERRSTWVELGVYKGRSLAWLIVAAAQRPVQLDIICVDLVPQVLDSRILNAPNLLLVHGDSAATASTFANESVDVVWVDADHSREACLRDIDAWWPRLRTGGYMGGDDYEMAGVREAVTQRFQFAHEVGYGTLTDGAEPRPYPYWLVRK